MSAGETPILRISEHPEIFVNLPFRINQQDDFVFNSVLSILFSRILRNMNSLQNSLCKIIEITENGTCKISLRQKKFVKSSETETKA